jgi:Na+/pantothenate symporter
VYDVGRFGVSTNGSKFSMAREAELKKVLILVMKLFAAILKLSSFSTEPKASFRSIFKWIKLVSYDLPKICWFMWSLTSMEFLQIGRLWCEG